MQFNPLSVKLPVLGIDINGPVVRVVQFSVGRKRKLVAVGESELPAGLAEDSFASEKDLGEAVKKALAEPLFGKFTAQLALASLPEHKCFARVIHVQAGMSDDEIEQAVPFEAESYIPMPLDQVYLDWQKIKSTDERTAVLLVAAPKEVVEKATNVIKSAGLLVAGLEVESMSLARGTLGVESSVDALVVDIGTNRTDLVVVEQGGLQFASNIPIAEAGFVDAAVTGLGLTKINAEKLVRKAGVDNTAEYPNLRQIMTKPISMLAAEVKNIINFHDQHSPRRFSKMILVGRGSALPNFVPTFANALNGNIQLELGDPWRAVNAVGVPEQFMGVSGVRFTAVIGLAVREVSNI